ncbi:MAG: polyprenyl synthetase family protein [Sulfurospirillum sp.]|nr:polyprenyl synthetase family protein [Sulfurospirillum sp.]
MNKKLLDDFESYLHANLPKAPSFHPHFEVALSEMLSAGGKRFRPMLLLSIVQAKRPLLLQNAYPVALGLEMLHTYSLIHDDLPCMDDAPLRRSQPTLHVKYDEVTAVLVGDALNTHAFYMLSHAPLSSDIRMELVKILSRDGGLDGMIIGQAIDCAFEDKKLTLEHLEFLHKHKTAKLIAASLLMGAVICELDAQTKKILYAFGLKLGLLFQIQDDIIDATLSEDEAGKTTANDSHKNSFVNLLGIEGAIASKQKLLNELREDSKNCDEDIAKNLSQIIDTYFKG